MGSRVVGCTLALASGALVGCIGCDVQDLLALPSALTPRADSWGETTRTAPTDLLALRGIDNLRTRRASENRDFLSLIGTICHKALL